MRPKSPPSDSLPELRPRPSALIESMRSIGYQPHTAIADLIDNSVTAGALNVQVEIRPGNESADGFVSILDDGSGMSADGLYKAMRWGGDGPKAKRTKTDLGRF